MPFLLIQTTNEMALVRLSAGVCVCVRTFGSLVYKLIPSPRKTFERENLTALFGTINNRKWCDYRLVDACLDFNQIKIIKHKVVINNDPKMKHRDFGSATAATRTEQKPRRPGTTQFQIRFFRFAFKYEIKMIKLFVKMIQSLNNYGRKRFPTNLRANNFKQTMDGWYTI